MPNMMPENFAERLKEIRKSKNLKQSDLARKTGLKVAAISFFETAKRRPSLGNLIKLADALSVSVDFILGREVARASKAADELLRDFEQLSVKNQEMIQEMVKLVLKKSPKD